MLSLKRISFEVLTEPVPLARPRVTKKGTFLPPRSRAYRAVIQQAAQVAMNHFEPMTGALFCNLEFYRKFKDTARNYGDADNHLKAILDALNGIVYLDDAQIVDISVKKRQDKAEQRIVVDIGCVGYEQFKPRNVFDDKSVYAVHVPRLCPCERLQAPTSPAEPSARY